VPATAARTGSSALAGHVAAARETITALIQRAVEAELARLEHEVRRGD